METSARSSYALRPAREADAAALTSLVAAAYGHYVGRLGMKPGPMRWDYTAVVGEYDVTVAEHDGVLVGLLVLSETADGFGIDNVAVHPAHQGKGVGRALLQRAEVEARRRGHDSVYLYTHAKMTENLDLYLRVGYVEYDRRSQGDFALVHLRKRLDESGSS